MLANSISRPRSIYAAKLREFPEFCFSNEAVFQQQGKWRDYFRARIGSAFDDRIIFDVGCADASFLMKIAAKFPATAFVGLDWKCKPLYTGARQIVELGLSNIALIRGRAQDVSRIFGKSELSEAWVFHPEPCNRPAELKNRLIAKSFLIDLHQALANEHSSLQMKTDHAGYFQWVLSLFGLPEPDWFQHTVAGFARFRAKDLMNKNDLPGVSRTVQQCFAVPIYSANYWHDPVALAHSSNKYFADESTVFESRFIKKRRPIYYVEMRKR
ncbi:MAG TPA: hypothetical protein VHD56_09420 [Tepidisphaeraceae bacterium]|nr:hypothetical protein [Tepidisphaeraceae bacterium]